MPTARTFVFAWLAGGFVPAGRLDMTDEPGAKFARFAYGRRYLERPDCVPIDPVSLPLQDIEFTTPEGFSLFGGIRDAAPDGWGQYLMYKALGDRLPSEIDVVLASGPYRVGALAFGPTAERPKRITPWGESDLAGEHLDLAELAEATERAQSVDLLDEGLRRLLTAGSSLGGARPKAAAELDGQSWIAKFPRRQDSFPECRVELATMRLAGHCGLTVPSLDFTTAMGRDIYLIERFDRQGGLRVPFVSGLTMLAAHEFEATRFAYADLAAALRVHGTTVAADLRELFRRMVFNILVTNDDDHLRNHGFLYQSGGWRLSPLYDVVPKPQVGLERQLILGVGPEGRTATLANAVAGSAQFGIARGAAVAIALEMAEQVNARWEAEFVAAGVGPADRARFATCFRMADPAVHLLEQA